MLTTMSNNEKLKIRIFFSILFGSICLLYAEFVIKCKIKHLNKNIDCIAIVMNFFFFEHLKKMISNKTTIDKHYLFFENKKHMFLFDKFSTIMIPAEYSERV